MAEEQFQRHSIDPFFQPDSSVLILGSFPSVKSREVGFFYGHPRNRFWDVLKEVYQDKKPETVSEKKVFLARHQVALWDSIRSCTIAGSSDSSIRNVTPNPIGELLGHTQIRKIICNGALSYRMYMKYVYPLTGIPARMLPSTSPANAAWSLTRLIDVWSAELSEEAEA